MPDPQIECDFVSLETILEPDIELVMDDTNTIGIQCELGWLLAKIDSAKSTLDVCMYIISYQMFADALIRAKDRGCRVRLITSREEEDTKSTLLQIRRAGIMVRTLELPTSELLHMKLVIVDKQFALTGSLNYTLCGFSGNAEEVACYPHRKLVIQFIEYFQSCWEDFSNVDRMLAMIKNRINKVELSDTFLGKCPPKTKQIIDYYNRF